MVLEDQNDDEVDNYDDNEMPTERTSTDEYRISDGEVDEEPTESSQRGVKRELDLDGQTEDDQAGPSKGPKAPKITSIQTETTAFDCYDFNDLAWNNQRRMKAESASDGPVVEPYQAGHEPSEPEGGEGPLVGDVLCKKESEEDCTESSEGNERRPSSESEMSSSDEEDGELSSKPNITISPNLKVVYDVEYIPPDESDEYIAPD